MNAMSTASLSTQLQDYLKKSNTENSSSSLLQNPLSGKFGWFAAKNNSHQQVEEEATVNGWFSDAQKDPLLPSLVSLVTHSRGYSTVSQNIVLYCSILS